MKQFLLYSFLFFIPFHCFSQTGSATDSLGTDSVRIKTEEWRKRIQSRINNNVPANNKAPLGTYTVIVRFKIDKAGNISDVTPQTSLGYGMEQEVVWVVRKGNGNSVNWAPAAPPGAKLPDANLKMEVYKIPIVFTVTKEDKKNSRRHRKKKDS